MRCVFYNGPHDGLEETLPKASPEIRFHDAAWTDEHATVRGWHVYKLKGESGDIALYFWDAWRPDVARPW